jgi:hypothetical protein
VIGWLRMIAAKTTALAGSRSAMMLAFWALQARWKKTQKYEQMMEPSGIWLVRLTKMPIVPKRMAADATCR